MTSIIPDFKIDGLWVRNVRTSAGIRATVSYSVWGSMRKRCKEGGKYQQALPTYSSCSMSAEFADFQTFANWYTVQIGYGLGYHLDKDILVPGNKLYSADTCVLVPPALNTFLVGREASRGLYPRGVNKHAKSGKFVAMVRDGSGSREYLGSFLTADAAFDAYVQGKTKKAQAWAERLRSDYVVDPRVIDAILQRDWRKQLDS